MACLNVDTRVSTVAGDTTVIANGQTSGNPAGGPIPIKVGEALSSACERNVIIGAIPSIVRYPGFTLVAGGVAARKPSSGGIQNMASFFKHREGCYHDKNAQLPSTCA